jgi:hypothetical protein
MSKSNPTFSQAATRSATGNWLYGHDREGKLTPEQIEWVEMQTRAREKPIVIHPDLTHASAEEKWRRYMEDKP